MSISLNVEPGGYRSEIARLFSTDGFAVLSSFQATFSADASCVASWVGSYDGVETIDSTAPVFGSSATTAPR